MSKIMPYIWFDDQAEEAAKFYVSIFKNSKIDDNSFYAEGLPKPKDSLMSVSFQLCGQEFVALNGGPYFTITPAISFFVNCETLDEVENLWQLLSKDGIVLMELGKYPFSENFGWLQDKFGVTWQINLSNQKQSIYPALMFFGDNYRKAQEAMNFYTSIFEDSKIASIEFYNDDEVETKGSVKSAVFVLRSQNFMAMDSSINHGFTFTPAISFFVDCETQEQIDNFWEKLSYEGKKGQCGWLEDKYGVSWQIVPSVLGELLNSSDEEKSQKVTDTMLKMNKLDIATLKRAYEQG
ncbi:VOC family protein [Clostridium sp. YIM B02505]|uniref:VOC family protein n=1 Tax=Clostridium yunnanense TaxID=2800325 RepID=A0ABS1EP53_9CLOT|nr:VOC family protein [Clostridium yunnanense]MBK1811161.1 VOC family protein [Clostridium yunnanense]